MVLIGIYFQSSFSNIQTTCLVELFMGLSSGHTLRNVSFERIADHTHFPPIIKICQTSDYNVYEIVRSETSCDIRVPLQQRAIAKFEIPTTNYTAWEIKSLETTYPAVGLVAA